MTLRSQLKRPPLREKRSSATASSVQRSDDSPGIMTSSTEHKSLQSKTIPELFEMLGEVSIFSF